MINPSEVGKAGEMVRLKTLEAIWIQGKLRMWGRWSYIGGGSGGNMFNQLLASGKVTKTAINEALRRMKKSGISKPELEAFFREILAGKNKSGLAFCTDDEGLLIDKVLGAVLITGGHKELYHLLVDHYRLLADELCDTGVNMGPSVASKFFQRWLTALNMRGKLYPDLIPDGAIGPRTITALKGYLSARGKEGEQVLLRALNCSQGARYLELAEGREANEDFLYGWVKERVL